jgi:hypothetical protein
MTAKKKKEKGKGKHYGKPQENPQRGKNLSKG